MSKPEGYFENIRTEMLPFIPPNTRKVLDVGCGVGKFGTLLKDRFEAVVWGVEMDTVAAGYASKVLDKVICSDFSESCLPIEPQFDCIVFNDVLEHMVAPEEALRLAKKLLQPNGVVVVSIPNMRQFYVLWDLIVGADWKYADAGILDRTHLRFFTKKSIIRMFENVGLRVTRCEGINNGGRVGRKYRILNGLLLGALSEMQFNQFAVVGGLNLK